MGLKVIFENNDTVVELYGLKDGVSGRPINDATATFTAFKDGVEVSGGSWPVSMTNIGGKRGVYRGVLEEALDLSEGEIVTVIVDVVGSGAQAQFSRDYKVRRRD